MPFKMTGLKAELKETMVPGAGRFSAVVEEYEGIPVEALKKHTNTNKVNALWKLGRLKKFMINKNILYIY